MNSAPKSTTALVGLKNIVTHVGRDKRTVMRWIREKGFPAKILAGKWESDTELIGRWRRQQIIK
jgi:hypothetical protein